MFCEVEKLPDLGVKSWYQVSLLPLKARALHLHFQSCFFSPCSCCSRLLRCSVSRCYYSCSSLHSSLLTGVWMYELWAVEHCRLRGLSVSQFSCVSLKHQSLCIDSLGLYWVHWARPMRSKLRALLVASPSFILCLWITIYRCNYSTLCAQWRWAFSPLPKAQSPPAK